MFNRKLIYFLLFTALPLTLQAKMGSVNYTAEGGAPSLSDATYFVVTVMSYVVDIIYAIASILIIVSGLEIYIKMVHGEQQTQQNILTLLFSIITILGASIVMPALFGWRDITV